MFDVGFFELALIGVVALLVLGPERLPKVARTVGMWVGRARRLVGNVKRDIEEEMQAEELHKVLNKRDELNPIREIVEETRGTFDDIKKETSEIVEQNKPERDKHPEP